MSSNTKICSIVVIFVVFCGICCNAAMFSQPCAKNPAYPGKCFDKITNRPMLPGKEYKPKGICATMSSDEEAKMITIETCPDIEMPGCVELPVDLRRSYPKCCPAFLCTDEKGNQITIDMTSE